MIVQVLTLIAILLSKSLYYETFGRNFLLVPFLFLVLGIYLLSTYRKNGFLAISENWQFAKAEILFFF